MQPPNLSTEMEEQALILRYHSKRRMYAEYEHTDPRLRRVLGHCAVYHSSSIYIRTIQSIEARLARSLDVHGESEEQGWSSSEDGDEDDEMEALLQCESIVTRASPPVLSPIEPVLDTFDLEIIPPVDLLADEKLVTSAENSCEMQHQAKPVAQEIIARSSFPNPLRSHPPTSEMSVADMPENVSVVSSRVNTHERKVSKDENTHLELTVMRMAKAMCKMLNTLHPASPWRKAFEDGDIEAQRWLKDAIASAELSIGFTEAESWYNLDSSMLVVCKQ